jgi:hypothetical protein
MKEQQKHVAWEEEVVRKYGIDLTRDRDLLAKVWERDAPFRDFEEFDACVENAWSYYSLGTEQAGGFWSSGSSGGRSSERGSKELVGSQIEADERVKARVNAFSEYLAKVASVDRNVMRLRKRMCGGPTRTISPEEAWELLEAHNIPDNKEAAGRIESLWWPDGSDYGRHFRVLENSILGELQRAAAYLEKHYPWTDDQAAYFILCGGVPIAATIRGTTRWHQDKGVAAHRYNRTTITLEVESWVPSDLVRKAYYRLQREIRHGPESRVYGSYKQSSPRNVAVFRFVVDQIEIQLVNADEHLARLKLPSWRKMLELWNEQLEHHSWRYKNVRNFRRDFMRGQEAIIGTQWGLPGVPGEPKNEEQVREDDIKRLRSRVRRKPPRSARNS